MTLVMGNTEKSVTVGDSLHDELWHTAVYKRRGMIITLGVDDETPLVGKATIVVRKQRRQGDLTKMNFTVEVFGAESFLDYSRLHVASIQPSHVMGTPSADFRGHVQQLTFNSVDFLDRIKTGLYNDYSLTGSFVNRREDIIYQPITFKSKFTYMGK